MRPTVRAACFVSLLSAAGLTAATAAAFLRETVGTIPAPADTAPAVAACAASATCRAALLQAVRWSLHAHEPALRAVAMLLACGLLCALLIRNRLPPPRPAAGGARYALARELRRLRTPRAGAWLPLGYLPLPRLLRRLDACRARGLCRFVAGPQVRLPADDLARHVLVVGLTGSHKTTAVTFPVLLEAARHEVSVIAFDLKYGEGDSLARTAVEWQRQARDVLAFVPLEPATLRWNPLDRCRTMGAAYQIAADLFDEPDPRDPDLAYWLGAERHVCAVLCLALSTGTEPATLGRLRALCESGPAAVDAYIRRHAEFQSLGPRLGAYGAMLPKDQAGILQGIAARLEAWGDEAVCAATGPAAPWERIDLNRVRREPVFLVVGIPQASLGRLRTLCQLFLRQVAATLLRPRTSEERTRVLLILEELPAWGALPGLADHLATYRSRQVSVIATLQSEAQGEHVYGRTGWAAVAANLVTRLYLPALADLDAERLSRVMGTSTQEDVAWSRGWGSAGTRRGEHRRAIPVPLAAPEVFREGAGVEDALVRCASLPPARLWCPPYYRRLEYRGRIPAGQITTADLAVYHHLWTARDGSHVSPPREPVPEPTAPAPAAPELATPAPPAQAPARSDAPVPARGDVPVLAGPVPVDDVRRLNQIVETLLLRARHDGIAVRVVHGRGRPVEVRVRPDVLLEICGGGDAMHELARRWSVLRWVRRVRPTFVLSRRALDVLEPRLLATLGDACGPESTTGSSRGGPGRL